MKICNITADSDISQFLKVGELNEILEKISGNKVESWKEETCGRLQKEINNGGLDEYSLNINGDIRGHIKALEINQNLEATLDSIGTTKSSIIEKAKKHREEEFSTYLKKLEEKIEELDSQLAAIDIKIAYSANSVDAFFGGHYADRYNVNKIKEEYLRKQAEAQMEQGKNE